MKSYKYTVIRDWHTLSLGLNSNINFRRSVFVDNVKRLYSLEFDFTLIADEIFVIIRLKSDDGHSYHDLVFCVADHMDIDEIEGIAEELITLRNFGLSPLPNATW